MWDRSRWIQQNLFPSPDDDPDKRHILFLKANGLTLEAVGSYSGVFARSASLWITDVANQDAETFEELLTVEIDKATYFRTVGGDPQVVQPGHYEVSTDEQGLVLTRADKASDQPIHVEAESMGTSVAVIMSNFNDNPDLDLLMLGTAGGQSLVAVGSHNGTFPRGLFKRFKRGIKKVGGKIKKGTRKASGTNKARGNVCSRESWAAYSEEREKRRPVFKEGLQ